VKVIGLTGIFGSGKSTVAGFLSELGATVIDADKIVHDLYKLDPECKRRLIEIFGRDIINASGYIDRRRIAAIVFKDRQALDKLNGAIHPLVTRELNARLADLRRKHIKVVVIEAPLLLEADWERIGNEIWVVTAPRSVICRRLHLKNKMPAEEVLTRIRMQQPVKELLKHASKVINTDTSLSHLKSKVKRLWEKQQDAFVRTSLSRRAARM
jgi:dephospho-CoA kinase